MLKPDLPEVWSCGPPQGPVCVALHGFGGSGQDFEGAAPGWGRRVWAPDLPGHGRSPVPAGGPEQGLAATLRGLGAVLDAAVQAGGPVELLGYSMGGRLALHLLRARPEAVARVVLIGASPGLADPAERAARRAADDALARQVLEEGAARFAERWAAQPLIATQARIPAPWGERLRARRAQNNPAGLAWALRALGPGQLEPLWEALPGFSQPALLVAGAEDPRYAALAQRMAAAWPGARVTQIPGAGHCAHLEAPEAFGALLRGG